MKIKLNEIETHLANHFNLCFSLLETKSGKVHPIENETFMTVATGTKKPENATFIYFLPLGSRSPN